MQREEKQLESSVDAILQRVNDLKGSIGAMLVKIEQEHETINWPTFLDNYALISGQVSSLSKVLRNEKTPMLRNQIFLPLLLNPDRDEELVRITEGRISTFTHDLVPDYLRTKPDPEVEQRMLQLEQKASQMNQEIAHKQVNAMNKVTSHILDSVLANAREDWDSEAGARAGAAQTSSVADTHALVAAINIGKNFKPMPGRPGPPQQASGPPGQQMQQQMASVNKMPSAVKTNIKSASQVHPYGR